MGYTEFLPKGILKHYVKCYFICESDSEMITEDKVFATGSVEIMFNIGTGKPQKIIYGNLTNEPLIQLWGQTTQPFTFSSLGKHCMFGVRFFPHTASCFFEEPIEDFNDQVIDFCDISGNGSVILQSQLVECNSAHDQIALVEKFLLARLSRFEGNFAKLKLINSIVHDLNRNDFFDNIHSLANRYGMSSRYLRKIFTNYSGLSPILFSKISRFQKSLQMVIKNDQPLTAIAYSCGYFDQSHFIKDFKYFTGSAPSLFSAESSTDLFAPLGN